MEDSSWMQMKEKFQYSIFVLLSFHLPFCISLEIDCEKDCPKEPDFTNPLYRPQDCAAKCPDKSEFTQMDFKELLQEVNSLRIMVIILLALVVLLILLFMVVFVKKMRLRQIFKKFYPKIRNKNCDLEKTKDEKIKDDSIRVNYSISANPEVCLESPEMTSSVRHESVSKSGQELGRDVRRKRGRMPSESTCPDESQVEQSGYDNLALSTSSINFNSRPSSPSSPNEVTASTVDISMNHLNTTMTTVQIDLGEDSSPRL